MKTKATVKIVTEERQGISQRTGNPWRSAMVLLEWLDLHGTNRVWCTLFNQTLFEFKQDGIQVGDEVEASFRFSTRSYHSGYNATEAELISIKKV